MNRATGVAAVKQFHGAKQLRISLVFPLFLLAGCSTSTYVLVGSPRPPIFVSDVAVYARPPAAFDEIAVLDANSRNSFTFTDQERMDLVIDRLKGIAASLGANGILFQGAANQYAGSIGVGSTSFTRGGLLSVAGAIPLSMKEAHGIAIYVPPAPSPVADSPPMDGARNAPAAKLITPVHQAPIDSGTGSTVPRVVGASFGPSTMGIGVLHVDKNTPASRSGLRAGDLITHINGRNIAPLYWENAVGLLTTSGSSVSIRLMGNEERTITYPQ